MSYVFVHGLLCMMDDSLLKGLRENSTISEHHAVWQKNYREIFTLQLSDAIVPSFFRAQKGDVDVYVVKEQGCLCTFA